MGVSVAPNQASTDAGSVVGGDEPRRPLAFNHTSTDAGSVVGSENASKQISSQERGMGILSMIRNPSGGRLAHEP